MDMVEAADTRTRLKSMRRNRWLVKLGVAVARRELRKFRMNRAKKAEEATPSPTVTKDKGKTDRKILSSLIWALIPTLLVAGINWQWSRIVEVVWPESSVIQAILFGTLVVIDVLIALGVILLFAKRDWYPSRDKLKTAKIPWLSLIYGAIGIFILLMVLHGWSTISYWPFGAATEQFRPVRAEAMVAATNRVITITRAWSEPVEVPLDYNIKWGRQATVAYESMDQDGRIRAYPRVLVPLPKRTTNLSSVRFRVTDPDVESVDLKLEFSPTGSVNEAKPEHLLPHRELPRFMEKLKVVKN